MSSWDVVERFVGSEYRRVVGAVALVCGSSELAEDCVQDATVRAWERLDRGHPIDSLPAWVTVVASNLARTHARRSGAEDRAVQRLAAIRPLLPAAAPGEDRLALSDALARLPRRQRQVVVLHYLLDQSVDAVADALGVRPGTVKTCLSRGREALSSLLDSTEEVTRGPVR